METRSRPISYKFVLETMVFIFPAVCMALIVAMKLKLGVDNDHWGALLHEDGIVEWLTFIFLFFAFLLSLVLCKKLANTGEYLASIFYFGVGCFCLFVALEEISYGQRIFGFETSEYLKEINDQQETSIHNISFMWLVSFYIGPFIVGMFGSCGWIFVKLIPLNFYRARKVAEQIVPPWFVMLYFLTTVVFVVWDYRQEGEWEVIGIMWWMDHEVFESLF